MKSNGVLLAVEDKLSDAVATKILKKQDREKNWLSRKRLS